MRQSIKFILSIIIIFLTFSPSFSALRGNLEYQIPIDYTKLDERDLGAQAEVFYNNALKSGARQNDDMTQALNLYTMLFNKNPENIQYALRLGKLYDVLGKDRYAKGNFYRAMGIDNTRPEPYFYLGDYYYSRQQYRKALKMYKRAYEKGYSGHYPTLEKLGEIYKMLGDTEEASKYPH